MKANPRTDDGDLISLQLIDRPRPTPDVGVPVAVVVRRDSCEPPTRGVQEMSRGPRGPKNRSAPPKNSQGGNINRDHDTLDIMQLMNNGLLRIEATQRGRLA